MACVLSAHLLYPLSMSTCLYLLDYPDVLSLPVYMIFFMCGINVCMGIYWYPLGQAEFPTPFPAFVDSEALKLKAPESQTVPGGASCQCCPLPLDF